MRFRKKPVLIDAVPFTADTIDDGTLLSHLDGCTGWQRTTDGIIIPTREGAHLASPGDFIIRGVAGEYYPCKPDIFAATYEHEDGRPVRA